jgi:exodeoxyribonuclease VII large subunit
VGAYAKALQGYMRERARVQVFGEVFNMRRGRGAKVYFELRDGDGAIPCSMWRNDFEKLGAAADAVVDGA